MANNAKIKVNFKVKRIFAGVLNAMRIGELSALSGVPASTIRFYEASGLLPAATRGANGYRLYTENALQQLRIIQMVQRLGFPLDVVRNVPLDAQNIPHALILEKLTTRLTEIETLQAALAIQKQEVESLLATFQQHWSVGQCAPLQDLVQPAS